VGDESKPRTKALVDAGVNLITIDIAHGHSIQMMETLKWLKDTYPQIEVIAGNLAMPDAARPAPTPSKSVSVRAQCVQLVSSRVPAFRNSQPLLSVQRSQIATAFL
jgi:hypothetical protein